MSTIRVGQGLFRKDLPTAIQTATANDVIVLDPGSHSFPNGFSIGSDVRIQGPSDAAPVIIETSFVVTGHLQLEGVMVRAAPGRNAISVSGAQARVDLSGAEVADDGSGQYPAVVVSAGHLFAADSRFSATPSADDPLGECVLVKDSGNLGLRNCHCGSAAVTALDASYVLLETATVLGSLRLLRQSKFMASGILRIDNTANQVGILADAGSGGEIESLSVGGDEPTLKVNESFLVIKQFARATDNPTDNLTVRTSGRCNVQAPPNVTVIDADAPRPVVWPADGTSWETIRQHLRQGDALVLEEGEYTIPEPATLAVDIQGRGQADRITLRAAITFLEGDHSLANFTLVGRADTNRLSVKGSADVVVRQVAVNSYGAGNCPPVWFEAPEHGRLTLAGCTVFHDAEINASLEDVRVAAGELEIRDSHVGRLFTDAGAARLTGVAFTGASNANRVTVKGTADVALTSSTVHTTGTENFPGVYLEKGTLLIEDSVLSHDTQQHPTLQDLFCTGGELTVRGSSATALLATGGTVRLTDTELTGPAAGNRVVVQDGTDVTMTRVKVHSDGTEIGTGTEAPVVLKGGRLTLEDCEISHDLSVLPDLTDVHTMGGVFTAIRTRFTRAFAGGGTVRLQDLEIRGSSAANRLSVKNGATVALTDVRVRSEGEGDCPPVWMEKGRLTLEDCTIVHDAEATPDLADLWVAGGEVFCERTTLDRIKALAGTTRLSDVTFTLLLAESGGRIISESTLHHHAPVRERFAVMVEDGSRVGLDRVVSDDEEFAVRVAGGSFALMSLEGPGPDGQYVRVDEKATLEGMALGMRRQDLNANPLTSGGPVGGVGGGGARDGGADGSDDQPASADGDAGGDPVARPSSADPADPTDQPSPASPADPMVEIEAMTGLVTVKKQIRSFLQTVEFNRAREAQGLRGIDLTLHSVFLGGPGTGKTTVARLFGKALHQAGVIPTDTFKEVDAEGLVSANIGETPTKTRAVLEQARGGVLFVDEAYTLYQESGTNYGTQAVDTILKFMEDNRREIVVIFAGYPAKMQDFLNMNPGLRSRVANEFTFEDYTPDEIVTMGLNMLAADGYTVNEELYGQVIRRKYATASERSNGRWVRNRNEELLKVLIGRVIGGGGDGGAADTSTILDEDLYAFGGGDATSKEQKVAELLAELDAMVGLAPVKEFVHDLVVQVRADQKLMRAGLTPSQPTYHMVFEGEPGTGKTTVARIIAEVFHALGILDRPDVIEVERKDLVGAYIGHTEKQTARAIDQAMGGVLFVDEAYQLTPEEGSGGSGNDFGKLAVETLITALEDKRSSFVAIFAGYTRPMERFLNQNPGLRSRVPHRIVFPDYTPGEIGTIVAARLGKQWQFDADLVRSVAAACYEATPPEERANGRWARTFAERIEKAHRHWILDHDVPAEDLARIDDQVVQGFAPSE